MLRARSHLKTIRSLLLGLAACAALAAPGVASASVTLGPQVANPEPDLRTQAINFADGTLVFTAQAPAGLHLAAPSSGVITRWRFYTDDVGTGVSVRLRVLAPGAANSYTAIRSGESEPIAPVIGDGPTQHNVLHEFDSRIPIDAGQIVGLGIASGKPADGSFIELGLSTWGPGEGWRLGCIAVASCGSTGPLVDGSSAVAEIQPEFQHLALNAEVEPDVDGDGLGDETQDGCVGVCQPPATTPITTTPVTTPQKKKCKKGKKLKRGKCVKKKAKKKKKKN